MKKLITIALLCAMVLSCFASCGSMQAGELDVDAYAEAGYENVDFRTVMEEPSVYSGSSDKNWYDADDIQSEYTLTTADQVMGLLQIIASGQNFEDVTIKLACDMDMNGADIGNRDSAKTFNGTFDGQGYIIGNWKLIATGGGRAFFSSLAGNAIVKDVSFVNATVEQTNTSKNRVGSVAGRILVEDGKTVTISNVYSNTNIIGVSQAITGGIVGQMEGAGSLVIKDCEYAGNIEVAGTQHGGIIGCVKTGKTVTVENCVVSGTIKGNDQTAGIIGAINKGDGKSSAFKGAVKIIDCSLSSTGRVESSKNGIGGIVGLTNFADVKASLTCKGCVVAGTVIGGQIMGGVVGYAEANKAGAHTFENCIVSGTISGTRTMGGIIGSKNDAGILNIKNCVVSAGISANVSSGSNNRSGGLVGILKSSAATISGNTFSGNATFTLTPTADAEAAICYVGGLVGCAIDTKSGHTSVYLDHNTVAGTLNFNNQDTVTTQTHSAAIFVGGALNHEAASGGTTIPTVEFGENNTYDVSNLIANMPVAISCANAPYNIQTVGYQTRDNGDGTYDLRYVFAMKNVFNGVGVKADIRYVDGEGVFYEKNQTIYVDTVYSYVMDEEDNLYAAEDYKMDYLYTLVVKGVPAEYSFEDKNLQVILKPFGATNNAGAITIEQNGLKVQGESLSNTSAQDMGINIDNFSATLDDKFVADGAIYIRGEDFDTTVSYGVHTGVKASTAECRGDYGPDAATPLAAPYHYYLDEGVTAVGRDLLNITYNFKVTESGWYDMCIDMRMKGSGTDGNGANQRNIMMLVDWAGGDKAYDLSFELENVADIKTDSAGSYMTGVKIYLEAGEHTMSFVSDDSFNGNYFHIRNIFLAKAD